MSRDQPVPHAPEWRVTFDTDAQDIRDDALRERATFYAALVRSGMDAAEAQRRSAAFEEAAATTERMIGADAFASTAEVLRDMRALTFAIPSPRLDSRAEAVSQFIDAIQAPLRGLVRDGYAMEAARISDAIWAALARDVTNGGDAP